MTVVKGGMQNGILNVLKPPGPTSSDIVTDVRRLAKQKRVGHCGTLDPGAAGVLSVCLGRATRLFDYMMQKSKSYRFEVQFGVRTDTLDSYGKVLERRAAHVTADQVSAVLPELEGSLWQVPPAYSALKQDGKKLYQLARAGAEIDLEGKGRTIELYSLKLVDQTGENTFMLDAHCSKGTYVRVLAEQVAKKLGTIGAVTFLMRTRSGGFELADCFSIAEATELAEQGRLTEALVPMDKAFFAPCVEVDGSLLHRLANGNAVEKSGVSGIEDVGGYKDMSLCEGIIKVYCGGHFMGLGYYDEEFLKIKTMLVDREELGC